MKLKGGVRSSLGADRLQRQEHGIFNVVGRKAMRHKPHSY